MILHGHPLVLTGMHALKSIRHLRLRSALLHHTCTKVLTKATGNQDG